MCKGAAMKAKVPNSLVNGSRLKEMGVTHDMRPFLLLNDSTTLLHAELNK
jgi:hypothetical protein